MIQRISSPRTLMTFLLGALLSACASSKVEKMDTSLEKSQAINSEERVGVKDGNAVIQRKVMLAEEVRKLERDVYGLEDEIYGNEKYGTMGLHGSYKQCVTKLSDPRLGGAGKLKPYKIEPRVTGEEDELKFVIDEKDQLVGVTEEMLRDRIRRFQGYRSTLRERKDEVSTNIEICEAEYKTALINNGFNPEDAEAKGEWVMGKNGYRVWRPKQRRTDDPEELSRRKTKREKKQDEDYQESID